MPVITAVTAELAVAVRPDRSALRSAVLAVGRTPVGRERALAWRDLWPGVAAFVPEEVVADVGPDGKLLCVLRYRTTVVAVPTGGPVRPGVPPTYGYLAPLPGLGYLQHPVPAGLARILPCGPPLEASCLPLRFVLPTHPRPLVLRIRPSRASVRPGSDLFTDGRIDRQRFGDTLLHTVVLVVPVPGHELGPFRVPPGQAHVRRFQDQRVAVFPGWSVVNQRVRVESSRAGVAMSEPDAKRRRVTVVA